MDFFFSLTVKYRPSGCLKDFNTPGDKLLVQFLQTTTNRVIKGESLARVMNDTSSIHLRYLTLLTWWFMSRSLLFGWVNSNYQHFFLNSGGNRTVVLSFKDFYLQVRVHVLGFVIKLGNFLRSIFFDSMLFYKPWWNLCPYLVWHFWEASCLLVHHHPCAVLCFSTPEEMAVNEYKFGRTAM